MNVVSINELKYKKYAKVSGDIDLRQDTIKPLQRENKQINSHDYIAAYIKLLTTKIN